MQKNKNEIFVFVQTDLLLQEKLFELLRECILNLNLTDVRSMDEFYYDIDKNEIRKFHSVLHPTFTNINWATAKLKNGNIFINLSNLEKLLSL